MQLGPLPGKFSVPQQLLALGVLIFSVDGGLGTGILQRFPQRPCGIALLAKQPVSVPDRGLDRDTTVIRNCDGDCLDGPNGPPISR